MFNAAYRRRLSRDMKRWQREGWVSETGVRAILDDIPPPSGLTRLPVLLGMLGAILLCFAAMSFVAANWQEIPRVFRLLLLFTALWAAYGLAIFLQARNLTAFSEAALVAALGFFGACIMLIAQMYHIDRSPANGVLLWAVGSLMTAYLARSWSSWVIYLVLIGVWSVSVAVLGSQIFQWQFLPLFLAAVYLAMLMPSGYNVHLLTLTFLVALFANSIEIFNWLDWDNLKGLLVLLELFILLFAGFSLLGHLNIGLKPTTILLQAYALLILLGLLFILQFALEDKFTISMTWIVSVAGILIISMIAVGIAVAWKELRINDALFLGVIGAGTVLLSLIAAEGLSDFAKLVLAWIMAFLIIAAAVWTAHWAQHKNLPVLVALALMVFGAEALTVYFKTLGGLINNSLFFLIGGLLFIGLAFILQRMHKRLRTTTVGLGA
ncbi:MAG: DUF2157 domain-containing protein [Methyloligellaceae bacterium]